MGFGSIAHAAGGVAMPDSVLHAVDWMMIALYASALLFIGWRASRRQQSAQEYFVGNRGFRSFTIGISMFVTLFSTISYLSGPGEVIRYGQTGVR